MTEKQQSTPSPIKVVQCYMDETGLLNSPRDKFFSVGMIKVYRPEDLYLQMKVLRDKLHYYDELKWAGIYNKNAPIIMQFYELFFSYGKARFSCYVFRKSDLDLKKYFKGDLFEAYQAFAAMQITSNLNSDEYAILTMDDMSTPKHIKMERNISSRVNTRAGRQAVLGATRAYSKGVELIQLTDLLLGAVIYDYKRSEGLIKGPGIPKGRVLDHMKKLAGQKSLVGDLKTNTLDIWNFKTK